MGISILFGQLLNALKCMKSHKIAHETPQNRLPQTPLGELTTLPHADPSRGKEWGTPYPIPLPRRLWPLYFARQEGKMDTHNFWNVAAPLGGGLLYACAGASISSRTWSGPLPSIPFPASPPFPPFPVGLLPHLYPPLHFPSPLPSSRNPAISPLWDEPYRPQKWSGPDPRSGWKSTPLCVCF